MLYKLDWDILRRLSKASPNAEFTEAEMLIVGFRTDPEVVRQVLPRPLRPVRGGKALAFLARYPTTSFGSTYNEGALFVQARFRGRVGGYCLAMPVDDDMAMIYGRESLGFPKKMAEHITLERDDDRVFGSVVRKGTEILRIDARLGPAMPLTDLHELGTMDDVTTLRVRSYLFKHFQSPSQRGFDYLPRLVGQDTLFRSRPGLRTGQAELTLGSSPYDPLATLPVREVTHCAYGIWDNTMLPGRFLRRIWNPWAFQPYAWFKYDAVPVMLGEVEPPAAPARRVA